MIIYIRSRLELKRKAQILKSGVLCVLFRKQRFKAITHRPFDADFGVIPHQAAFILRIIEAGALVHESRRFAELHLYTKVAVSLSTTKPWAKPSGM